MSLLTNSHNPLLAMFFIFPDLFKCFLHFVNCRHLELEKQIYLRQTHHISMLTEAPMLLPSWISNNKQKKNQQWEKGKLLPEFSQEHDTWGIWKCAHESWLTRGEWTAGDVVIHSETIGPDVEAAKGRHFGCCRDWTWDRLWNCLMSLLPQPRPHQSDEKFKTTIKCEIRVTPSVCQWPFEGQLATDL